MVDQSPSYLQCNVCVGQIVASVQFSTTFPQRGNPDLLKSAPFKEIKPTHGFRVSSLAVVCTVINILTLLCEAAIRQRLQTDLGRRKTMLLFPPPAALTTPTPRESKETKICKHQCGCSLQPNEYLCPLKLKIHEWQIPVFLSKGNLLVVYEHLNNSTRYMIILII